MDSVQGLRAEKDAKVKLLADMNRDGNLSWDERLRAIKKQFPSVERLNWDKALANDVELFGNIIRDVLRHDQAEPGRDGPKPEIGYRQGVRRIQQFMGEDFSLLPFPEAFRNLTAGMSLTPLARKTSMSRMNCSRLLRGEKEPHVDEMILIAKAFKKDPSYFVEYRAAYIMSYIAQHCEQAPEVSVNLYKRLQKAKKY